MRSRPMSWFGRRSRRTVCLTIVTTIALTVAAARGTRSTSMYLVNPERSRVLIKVGKAGALSFVAGHTHEVVTPLRGTVAVDLAHLEASVIDIEIRTAELTVTGEGEPPQDVPKVQETMAGPGVLDVARYPTIAFRSASVAAVTRRGDGVDLAVTGDLTLHGETQRISVPVHAELARGTMTAQGAFSVRQTDYGIKPPSVAGMVSVRNTLDIRFTVVAAAE